MSVEKLFTQLRIGLITTPNRVLMLSLTRLRSIKSSNILTPLMDEYYYQRAITGLIVSEATQASWQVIGYDGESSLCNQEQTTTWGNIIASVYAADNRIAIQLWCLGVAKGSRLDAQSLFFLTVQCTGFTTSLCKKKYHIFQVNTNNAHAAQLGVTPNIVNNFRQLNSNACKANFDIVEVHLICAYTLYQLISPSSSQRTGRYDGSVKNEVKLVPEVIDAVSLEKPPDHINICISSVYTVQKSTMVHMKKPVRYT